MYIDQLDITRLINCIENQKRNSLLIRAVYEVRMKKIATIQSVWMYMVYIEYIPKFNVFGTIIIQSCKHADKKFTQKPTRLVLDKKFKVTCSGIKKSNHTQMSKI